MGFDLYIEEAPLGRRSLLLSMTFKFLLYVEERKLALPTQFTLGLQGCQEFLDVHGPVLVEQLSPRL